jgi:hypothetical protein
VARTFDSRRELAQQMVLAELLARRGEGPLARRVLLTKPRSDEAATDEPVADLERTP